MVVWLKLALVILNLTVGAATTSPTTMPVARDNRLDGLLAKTVAQACEKFADEKLKENELAITIIDLHHREHPQTGSFRGDAGFYPASVIKLFYLAAAQQWLEEGKLNDSPELKKTLREMIVVSSNEATGKLVDLLSGVANGPALPDQEMKVWTARRNAVNDYFKSLGYDGINVCQKTYAGSSPVGREREFLGPNFENRNKLTTDATARLLSEIVLGRAVNPARSKQMMQLLKRNPTTKPSGPDDQNIGFTAKAFPLDRTGYKLWCKSGWTSKDRHDAAYIETPDGIKAVLVIFTVGHGYQRDILPFIAKNVLDGMRGP